MTVYLQNGPDGSVYLVDTFLDDSGVAGITMIPTSNTIPATEPLIVEVPIQTPSQGQSTGVVDSATYHLQNAGFWIIGLAFGALLTEKIMTLSEAAGGFSRISFP